MSSFTKITKHPITGEWLPAEWIENFYGWGKYGVRFPNKYIYSENEYKFETRDLTAKENAMMDEAIASSDLAMPVSVEEKWEEKLLNKFCLFGKISTEHAREIKDIIKQARQEAEKEGYDNAYKKIPNPCYSQAEVDRISREARNEAIDELQEKIIKYVFNAYPIRTSEIEEIFQNLKSK